MAGAFTPQGVVGFSDIAENSMVRSPQRPTGGGYINLTGGYTGVGGGGPYGGGGGAASSAMVTNQYAPQPFSPAAPAAPSSGVGDWEAMINRAWDHQAKLAAEAAGVQWNSEMAQSGFHPADKNSRSLQSEILSNLMNPVAAGRSQALSNAWQVNANLEQQRLRDAEDARRWNAEHAMSAQQFQMQMAQQAKQLGQGGWAIQNPDGSTTYTSGGGGSAPAAPRYNSEQAGFDAMMAQAQAMREASAAAPTRLPSTSLSSGAPQAAMGGTTFLPTISGGDPDYGGPGNWSIQGRPSLGPSSAPTSLAGSIASGISSAGRGASSVAAPVSGGNYPTLRPTGTGARATTLNGAR